MKKVIFTKDFTHGNKSVDKKGKVKMVTSRHADFLIANKIANLVKGKEDKEAEERETK
jgi:hypothetical protein